MLVLFRHIIGYLVKLILAYRLLLKLRPTYDAAAAGSYNTPQAYIRFASSV